MFLPILIAPRAPRAGNNGLTASATDINALARSKLIDMNSLNSEV